MVAVSVWRYDVEELTFKRGGYFESNCLKPKFQSSWFSISEYRHVPSHTAIDGRPS